MTEEERRQAHLARRGVKANRDYPKWFYKVKLAPGVQEHLDYVKKIQIDLNGPSVVISYPQK
jgi:hypothetical protein